MRVDYCTGYFYTKCWMPWGGMGGREDGIGIGGGMIPFSIVFKVLLVGIG